MTNRLVFLFCVDTCAIHHQKCHTKCLIKKNGFPRNWFRYMIVFQQEKCGSLFVQCASIRTSDNNTIYISSIKSNLTHLSVSNEFIKKWITSFFMYEIEFCEVWGCFEAAHSGADVQRKPWDRNKIRLHDGIFATQLEICVREMRSTLKMLRSACSKSSCKISFINVLWTFMGFTDECKNLIITPVFNEIYTN